FWSGNSAGVIGLVGLGGAGKTAIAARFLDDLLSVGAWSEEHAPTERPRGLLVWSFYQEPDAGSFLQAACRYFSADAAALAAKGIGLLHLLRDALAQGGRNLLLLDGLERVQLPDTDASAAYGQIDDPLLKLLLRWLAEGVGDTTVLVTSRFPLTDLSENA